MTRSPHNLNAMGLAEAATHLAALAALSWLLRHVWAREALRSVSDRMAGRLGARAERSAARAVDRLCREAGRLGMETAPAAGPERPGGRR